MAKRRLKEDLTVVVAVEEEAVVAMIDAQDNHVKVVVMPVLLKQVKPKVQLIDQNDLTVNGDDVLHVVVPVAVQEGEDSTARVVIQNHPKSHSIKKKDLEPATGVQLRMNFKVKQKRLKLKLKAKRLMNQRKK